MGCVPPTFTLAITLLVEHSYPFLVKPVLGKNPELWLIGS
jgi:hypothetical protein